MDIVENLEQGPQAALETEGDQESLDKARRAAVLGSATKSTLQELGRRKRVVVKLEQRVEFAQCPGPKGETRGRQERAGTARAAKRGDQAGVTDPPTPTGRRGDGGGTSSAAHGMVEVKQELGDQVVKPQVLQKSASQRAVDQQDVQA